MKALTIIPGKANSIELREVPEPQRVAGDLVCEMLAVGVCGTDFEMASGQYGKAPKNSEYLILGHESLGRVLETPISSNFKVGDLIVGIVRRPDPVPCPNCAMGEWDMCQNGLYQERGINGLHGYASERFTVSQDFAVKLNDNLQSVGVLLEPASVVAKAWEQCQRISARTTIAPKRALITGAGPIGLLAGLMGIQKGFEIHILDQVKDGPKPDLVKSLGATYHWDFSSLEKTQLEFDITLECTGVVDLIYKLMNHVRPNGILCLTGISSGGRTFATDIGKLNLDIVLQNEVIFGSVNANRRHYEAAASALAQADLLWLSRLITRRIPLGRWQEAFTKVKTDVKTILVTEPTTAKSSSN